jgi:hypothetical protein
MKRAMSNGLIRKVAQTFSTSSLIRCFSACGAAALSWSRQRFQFSVSGCF